MPRPIELTIRRATSVDKRAVREITRTIWGGNDYLPDRFDEWVRDRRGGLWLATVGARAVGVGKLTLLGDHEAWLHALRVHPRWRRRGVAGALIALRLARAKRLGVRVARLDTADDNAAVHRLMRRFGFRRVGRYAFWRKPARTGERPRRANARELPALWRLARRAPLLHLAWTRRVLARADLQRAVREQRCFFVGSAGSPRAMAIVEADGERLRVPHLAGTTLALGELLAQLPAEAQHRGCKRVVISGTPGQWAALRDARYRRSWSGSMFLFEKRL